MSFPKCYAEFSTEKYRYYGGSRHYDGLCNGKAAQGSCDEILSKLALIDPKTPLFHTGVRVEETTHTFWQKLFCMEGTTKVASFADYRNNMPEISAGKFLALVQKAQSEGIHFLSDQKASDS